MANSTYDQWKKGTIKFEDRETTRSSSPFDEEFRSRLFNKTRHSYCQKNYFDFQTQIQGAHDLVHVRVGGSMGDANYASYDPIFYMHHNYVDRQYAYFQALQESRSRIIIYPSNQNQEMPPFSGKTNQPTESPNIPNPISLTKGDHSRPNKGLNYESIFKYKYDSLKFDGVTPPNFDDSFQSSCPQAVVRVDMSGLPSLNKIFVQGTERSITESLEEYAFLTSNSRTLEVDLTAALQKYNLNFEDKKINFEIVSYDLEGNNIIENNAYKPTVENIQNDKEIITYHTKYFDKYKPDLKISNLFTMVEFIDSDGSLSNKVQVVLDSSGNTKAVTEPFLITSTSHSFLFGGKRIVVGLRLDYHLEVEIF